MSELAPSELAVDLGAYAHNLGVVREYIPQECGILAVVKANAYGLGAAPLARQAVESGVAMLGVATVEEGIALREAGIEIPILVLVHPDDGALGPAIEHGLRLTISNVATAERLGEFARKAKKIAAVHCEVDTGMGRQGFSVEEAPSELLRLTRISNVDIEGIATHFPGADVPNDLFTQNQIKTFRQLLKQLDKNGIPFEMAHAANSAAVVNFPASALDLVRPGLMTYGVWPTSQPPADGPLKPVVRWTSRIALLRDLPGGASISYNRTYKAPSPMRTAIVPVGYADGYRHKLSNTADVLIHGARCSVRGSVCMDETVVDVTHLDAVAVGDTVTLLGNDGSESISVEELAQKAETIPYEILTGIGPRTKRTYGTLS